MVPENDLITDIAEIINDDAIFSLDSVDKAQRAYCYILAESVVEKVIEWMSSREQFGEPAFIAAGILSAEMERSQILRGFSR